MKQADLTNYLDGVLDKNEWEQMSLESGISTDALKDKFTEKLGSGLLLKSSRSRKNTTKGEFTISVISGLEVEIKYRLEGSSASDWSLNLELILKLFGQEVASRGFSLGPNNTSASYDLNGLLFKLGISFEVKNVFSRDISLHVKAKGCLKKPAFNWDGWEWQCAEINETFNLPFA